MKKLFSLLTAIVLSAGMVTYAEKAQWYFTWDQFCTNEYVSMGTAATYPAYCYCWGDNCEFQLIMTFNTANKGIWYDSQNNAYDMPAKGTYTVQPGSSGGMKIANITSGWCGYNSSPSAFFFQSTFYLYRGTFYVEEGADGPYIHTAENTMIVKTSSSASEDGYYGVYVGSPAVYCTITVQANDNTYGYVDSEYKSGYVYANNRSQEYKKNSTYTLKATETNGIFVEWQKNGNRISGEKEVDVTIDGNATYTAVFTAASGGTITVNAGSNGQVKLDNGSWGSSFNDTYEGGTNVQIAAQANSGYLFYQWSDNAGNTNSSNPYTITVSGDNTYTAQFKRAYMLTADVDNPSYGSVSLTEPYRDGKYYDGQSVTLTATPANSFSSFVKWQKNGVDYAGGASINVTVNANDTYTAFFAEREIETVLFTNATYNLQGNYFEFGGTNADYEIQFASFKTYIQSARFEHSNIWYTKLIHNSNEMTFENYAADIVNMQGDLWFYHAYLYNTTGTVYDVYAYFHVPISNEQGNNNTGREFTINQITYDNEDGFYFIESDFDITQGSQYTDKYSAGIQIYLPNNGCGILSGTYPISGSGLEETAGSGYVTADNSLAGTYLYDYRKDDMFGGAYNYYWLLQSGFVEVTNRDGVFVAHASGKNSKGNDVSYTIKSAGAPNTYAVTLTAGNGGIGQITYISSCGTEVYSATPTTTQKFFSGNTITLTATPNNSYEFWRWSDEDASVKTSAYGASRNVTVSGNLTLQAIFRTSGPATYTVNVAVDEAGHGTVTADKDKVDEGGSVTVTYTETQYTSLTNETVAGFYRFVRWSDEDENAVSAGTQRTISNVNADIELTAVTELKTDLVLYDAMPDEYYDDMAKAYYNNGAKQLKSITYQRTLPVNQWTAFSLPFNMVLEDTDLDGKVYAYTGATGNADEGLNVNFAKNGSSIEAGVPYLFYSTTPLTNPTFTPTNGGAALQLTEAIKTPGYTYGQTGSVRFTGTNRCTPLTGGDKSIIYLTRNRLYYPNKAGNTMRAFRGYFKVPAEQQGVTPRLRIVAEGQTVTEIEAVVEDGQQATVRKYIENGVLVIERNGVRYDATGARME